MKHRNSGVLFSNFSRSAGHLTVGDFAKWMAEEKGEAVSKQRVYSALRVLVERKQLQRKEAGIYQLAGSALRRRGRAA
jgi:Fe2+ or Zn2+ uptake regulation protein